MDALLSRGAAEISANRQWQKVLEIDFTRVRLFKTLHGDWRTAMWVTMFKGLSWCLCVFLIAGCAVSTQITNTPRSVIEQQLLVRALQRAVFAIDTQQFKEKTVAVEFSRLTPDKDFARSFFIAWLQSQRVRIAANPTLAQLHLQVFASVLAVDQGQSFVGTPAFTVPLIGITIPEIALFRDVKHSGHAEIKIFATDGETGDFVGASAPAIGKSNHDDFTLLIIVHFTHTDLEKERWDLGNNG
jgi:hypothetical protein